MQRRYTVMSLVVMGAVAWVLLSPTKMQKPEPPKQTPEARDIPKPILPKPSLSMMSVVLPPPPEAPSPAPTTRPTTVVPMTAAIAGSPEANRPPPVKPIAPAPAQKLPQINPLTATPAPKPVPLSPQTSPRPILQKTALNLPSSLPAKKPVSSADADDLTQQKNRIVPSTAESKRKGRPLLKLLEFGKGPSIEIGWPDDGPTRDRLFRVFDQCYGMRIAFMNEDGALFDDSGQNGQPWVFNSDKFSGFVRQSQGHAGLSEGAKIRSIRHRHGLGTGNAVRLFPRETDALLLAGLQHLIGADYSKNKTIQARYQISGWRVSVGDIRSNGTPITGSVDLSGAVKTRCLI